MTKFIMTETFHRGGVIFEQGSEFFLSCVNLPNKRRFKRTNLKFYKTEAEARKVAEKELEKLQIETKAPPGRGTIILNKAKTCWRVKFQMKECRYDKRFWIHDNNDKIEKQRVYEEAERHRIEKSLEFKLSVDLFRAPTKEIGAYISGFMDGDGSLIFGTADDKTRIYETNDTHMFRFSVGFFQSSNNDQIPDVLKFISNIYKVPHTLQLDKPEGDRMIQEKLCFCKDAYGLRFYGIYTLGILTDLAQYCVSKQKEAQLCLTYIQSRFENGTNTVAYTKSIVNQKNKLFEKRIHQNFDNIHLLDAYVSGFFDADGCILITPSNNYTTYTIRIQVAQPSCPGLLKPLLNKYGGSIKKYISKKRKELPQVQWYLSGKDKVKQFIQDIVPYSMVKKEQLEIGLQFIELIGKNGVEYREQHKKMYERVKALKRKTFYDDNDEKEDVEYYENIVDMEI